MKITYDLNEFAERTQWIMDSDHLARLGFTNCSIGGAFFPSAVEELLDFCARNPGYHIISMINDDVFINRYDERGGVFSLAEGDKDPDYALNAGDIIQETLERVAEMMGRDKRD